MPHSGLPLTPERWAQIERVLDAVLDHDPDSWPALLDEICAGDPDLHREVQALLQRHPKIDRFLQWSPDEAVAGPVPVTDTDEPALSYEGRRIGPYRLRREIGRGGTGRVFLADRADDHFEQQVALKLLHVDLDTPHTRRRLRAERQILAHLQHPNVAQLLDGGVTDAGHPYLVMEHVDGQPIDRYCDEKQLSVRERLQLFVRIGDAVQHAHRNLVVHRDLKPANILVTENDQVKLLDFGIAKLLDPDTASVTLPRTRTGQRWMTPEYAAPEQIRGRAVTTATDVYQLGVILYELLAGSRPFECRGNSLHELERMILTQTPEKPSMAVAVSTERSPETGSPKPESVSRARGTGPRQLRRTLKGDLDTIVLKALRKEPEARYASAEAFVEDVRRYLAGRPVQARRGSWSYRAKKFIRRHRWGVGMTLVLMLVLIGSAVVLGIQANRVARERDRAQQTADFLVTLFQEFEPVEMQGDLVSAREVLDRGVEQIRHELSSQPLLQAELLDVIGQVYQYRGFFGDAERALKRALALRRQHLAPDHLDVADSQLHLAILRYNVDDPNSDSLFQAAIATYRKQLGPNHSWVLYAMTNRAIALRANGNYAEAESVFRDVLAVQRQAPNVSARSTATARTYLGKLLTWKGEYDEAETLLHEALRLQRATSGEEHPVVANILEALGELHLARGRYEQAEQTLHEVQAMRRTFFDEDHPDLGAGLITLGRIHHARDDVENAERLFRDALFIYRRSFGRSISVATLLRHLAVTLQAQGRLEASERVFREALAIWQDERPDSRHPERAQLLRDVAALRIAQDAPQQAEPLLRNALALQEQILRTDNWHRAAVQSQLGHCLTELGRYREAEPLLLDSYATLKAKWGPQHPRAQEAAQYLAALYGAWKRPGRAAEHQTP